jgi:type IV pilus assembly protein PilM
MAKSNAVWGIDIGQCALKALRCRPNEDASRVTADAFDYIEYPQILSQPEADPVELVREALEQFLSRNSVHGDRVAISVSGQSGLARFIKLPPVESKKIPDIVKYEARQQIPFALEDVVWDYQQMAGGSEEEGFSLETEVGLFAMKRDQVYRALKPFEDAGIEVDIIQLTPLAIYNYTVFDQMQDLPPSDEYDPENPPESVVVLSLGTDTTDLVITNGYRVWQRSVPLGGSHFTKALSKELRLTFAKAEHLKRNAMQAEDRGAVFQAMRPIFSDLLTEVQRSIGFFTNIDRSANIGRVLALGNAMKLPGLQKYLSQNLGYPVTEVESYRGISGSAVVSSPAFKENLLSFAVCYGLVLQALAKGKLSTNLLPREIVTDRLIRDKKPWAVGLVAAILLGCSISFLGYWRAWSSAQLSKFTDRISQAEAVKNKSKKYTDDYQANLKIFQDFDKMGQNIVGGVEGRLLWAELIKVIDTCLPHDPENRPKPTDIRDRNELHITELDCEHRADLASWYAEVKAKIDEANYVPSAAGSPAAPGGVPQAPGAAPPAGAVPAAPGAPGVSPAVPGAVPPAVPNPAIPNPAATAGAKPPGPPVAGQPAPGAAGTGAAGAAGATPVAGPTGEGWVIQLRGYHYHNKHRGLEGAQFVREQFLKRLENDKVTLPVGKNHAPEQVSIKDMGISYPVLINPSQIDNEEMLNPEAQDDEDNPAVPKTIQVPRFDFVVQFCWQETPPSTRAKKKSERAAAAALAAAAAASDPTAGQPAPAAPPANP